MKNLIFLLIIVVLFISCSKKDNRTESITINESGVAAITGPSEEISLDIVTCESKNGAVICTSKKYGSFNPESCKAEKETGFITCPVNGVNIAISCGAEIGGIITCFDLISGEVIVIDICRANRNTGTITCNP